MMHNPLRSIPPVAAKNAWQSLADPARLRAVWDSGLLEERIPALDRLVHVLIEVTNAKVATISLVDEDHERLVGSYGVPEPWFEDGVVSLQQSFAKWVVSSGSALIVEDARHDPLLADCEPVLGWGVVAYAGHPICGPGGHSLGAVAVMDIRPRRWTMGELNLLREVATSVATEVRARASKRALIAKAAVLDAMMSALGEDVSVYDAGGRLLSSNRRTRASRTAQTVIPLAREPQFSQSASEPPLPLHRTPVARALLGERTSQDWFVRDLEHISGRWCHVAATPVIDARSTVIGAVVVTSRSSSHGDGRSFPSR